MSELEQSLTEEIATLSVQQKVRVLDYVRVIREEPDNDQRSSDIADKPFEWSRFSERARNPRLFPTRTRWTFRGGHSVRDAGGTVPMATRVVIDADVLLTIFLKDQFTTNAGLLLDQATSRG